MEDAREPRTEVERLRSRLREYMANKAHAGLEHERLRKAALDVLNHPYSAKARNALDRELGTNPIKRAKDLADARS